ncbi:putative gamma-glutamylcyclotransferase CG2811 isoform X2 [Eriocheir sinensis]|nr:putative gamma-glutamylcyclotransferase CG2811 isoform X2 [Eriocheir sinensis]
MSARHLVFVYGTLRKNMLNHSRLLDAANGAARCLGLATTTERYPLVIASRYNIPYLLAAPGHGQHVRGEVYEVDDKMLETLDALENHPKYYERKEKKIKLEDSGEERECWVYLLHCYKPHLMDLPFLEDYCAVDDPEKVYIARCLRKEPGPEYWVDVKLDE